MDMVIEELINKPGGVAHVSAIEQVSGGWRYHLASESGEARVLDLPGPLADVTVGDEFDYEGAFDDPARISLGGQVLWERPAAR